MSFLTQPWMFGLWMAVIIAETYVLGLLLGRKGCLEYPAFTTFVGFNVTRSLVMFYVASYWAPWYQAVRGVIYPLQLPILAVLVWEVFRTLFYPVNALPQRTVMRFVQATLAVTVVAIVFAILHPGAHATAWVRFARSTDQVVTWVLYAVFGFIAIFAKYFGIPWRHRVFGIAAGFLVYLSVDVVVETALAQLGLRPYHGVTYLGMVAFFTACLIWARYFALPEAARTMPSVNELKRLRLLLAQFGASLKSSQASASNLGREQELWHSESGDRSRAVISEEGGNVE